MKFGDKVGRGLKFAGGTLHHGFGPKLAIGIFISYLDDVSVDDLYDYLKDNRSRLTEVFNEMSEDDLNKSKALAHKYLDGPPAIEDVLKSLAKRRSDLAGVIINTPNGYDWLKKELDVATEKLG